ncbi:MAG: translation initiation factor IF-2 N-terminal domain-containing protein [Acidobacteria bacterium]|nr:translation initiation factor IF-2 N-terminal domain-containing protein [Acidobacteriota bacterium]MCW5968240.1 translation initiation factor IF-2 N-terminal domain-containing protein [Blastocatellales bacterium]
MARVRVYSLAKELQVDNQRVIDMARELGADVSRPSNVLDDAIADKIRELQADLTAPAKAPDKASNKDPDAPVEKLQTQSARPEASPAQPSHKPPSHSTKRSYLVDGLNICNWGKETTLAPLVTLLIELKRRGHPFVCICDANSRFVLEERGERSHYEHLLEKYDCIGEVPGGTQADDFLLFRAHKTGEAIITNDQYRDPRYRERYKWLRSISPRLCKGIVVGGYLMIPELDIHAPIRTSLSAGIREFDELFGRAKPHARTAHATAEHAHASKTKAETVVEQTQETPPSEPVVESTEAAGDAQPQRPRSRRRRRRGGKRATPAAG